MLGFKESIHDGFERKTQEVVDTRRTASTCLPCWCAMTSGLRSDGTTSLSSR
jgi:hypothetical protein